jgi:hypothetical protein
MVIQGGEAVGDLLVTCATDEHLYLPALGWMTTRRYHAYQGRSPRTGEPVQVPSRRP